MAPRQKAEMSSVSPVSNLTNARLEVLSEASTNMNGARQGTEHNNKCESSNYIWTSDLRCISRSRHINDYHTWLGFLDFKDQLQGRKYELPERWQRILGSSMRLDHPPSQLQNLKLEAHEQ